MSIVRRVKTFVVTRTGKALFVLGACCALFQAIHWWEGRGAGFRLYKIQSSPAFDERWETSMTDEDLQEARAALAQPYHYLGHGFQVYAFSSADDKYVLKFFRHQRLRLPEFVMSIPSLPFFDEWRKSRLMSLSRRKDHLFRSSKTSWDIARDQTILMMVHLNTTEALLPTVSIQDLLGNVFPIELDKYQFLLQRKAVLIKPTIASLMKAGKEDAARHRIDQIFALFVDCARKGIADTDGALVRKNNLGFFEDRAIYIDGGKLIPRKRPCTRKDFVRDIKRLRPLAQWLKQEYPKLAKYFEQAREKAIEAVEQHVACDKSPLSHDEAPVASLVPSKPEVSTTSNGEA
jgi:hypothetical protein